MKNSKAMNDEMVYESKNWRTLTLLHCEERAEADFHRLIEMDEFYKQRRARKLAEAVCSEWWGEDCHRLPYNLSMGTWGKTSEEIRRFCGWIKAAAEFPVLVRLISRSTSRRGQNSPYTYVDLWDLATAHPSPGHFARFLVKVRNRASQILEPYGLRPSWVAMAKIFLRSSQTAVGKTAVKVAGETVRRFLAEGRDDKRIGEFSGTARSVLIKSRGLRDAISGPRGKLCWAFDRVEAGEFSCLREALENQCLFYDTTDGVELWLDIKSEEVLHGVRTMKGYSNYGGAHWLVLRGGRSYHLEINPYRKEGRRSAIRLALQAWKRRAEEDARDQAFLQKILPEDRTILVFVSDSLATGNCRPGTMAFMRSNGWGGRSFVPAPWLVRYKSREDVRRVLTSVASKL